MEQEIEEEPIVAQLRDYLIRTGFKELCIANMLADPGLAVNTKQTLEAYFDPQCSEVILGHLTFHRRGAQWSYEMYSKASPPLMAEEVTLRLRDAYPRGTTLSMPDYTFLSRVQEVHEQVIEEHIVEEGILDREEVADLRFGVSEEFFAFVGEKLFNEGYTKLTVDSGSIARVIHYIEQYGLIKAIES